MTVTLNLRQAIIQRMQNKTDDELKEIIEDSIDGDERALPGIGVLFEIIWRNSPADMQSQLVSTLNQHLT